LKRFAEKVVLITGGNRNTGLWLVKKFIDEGARVFTCARNEKSAADGVKSLAEMGVTGVRMLLCDISKREEVDAMFDTIEKEAGTLDISSTTPPTRASAMAGRWR